MKTRKGFRMLAPKRTGPKPPPGGRVRISVNLPAKLLPFVRSLDGRSLSAKIIGALQTASEAK